GLSEQFAVRADQLDLQRALELFAVRVGQGDGDQDLILGFDGSGRPRGEQGRFRLVAGREQQAQGQNGEDSAAYQADPDQRTGPAPATVSGHGIPPYIIGAEKCSNSSGSRLAGPL